MAAQLRGPHSPALRSPSCSSGTHCGVACSCKLQRHARRRGGDHTARTRRRRRHRRRRRLAQQPRRATRRRRCARRPPDVAMLACVRDTRSLLLSPRRVGDICACDGGGETGQRTERPPVSLGARHIWRPHRKAGVVAEGVLGRLCVRAPRRTRVQHCCHTTGGVPSQPSCSSRVPRGALPAAHGAA